MSITSTERKFNFGSSFIMFVPQCCTMIENGGLICAAAFKKEVVAR